MFGFGAWFVSLPQAASGAGGPTITAQEADATIAALKPVKRPRRPVVAIIGLNEATETTDYLMPYGILKRADVADVFALSTRPGPVTLYPALTVVPDATIAEFDAIHAEGADYVIVPAMSRDDNPEVLGWIRSQAAKGAVIVAVCAGAKVLAESGLLDGKRATTHWFYLDKLRSENPTISYVPDRRIVVDRGVVTTTGISASMPLSLLMIEAIAGRTKAQSVAAQLGLTHWDARHASGAFALTRPFVLTSIGNRLAFWNQEQFGIELTPGIDEVSLALVADVWSRTYRSRALTHARTAGSIRTHNGLRVVPDRVAVSWPTYRTLPAIGYRPPAHALDEALAAIEARYGAPTADLVAMQLEYARP